MDQAENLRNIIKKQNLKPAKTARVITVTSGKGGVGKSNVSINLALQFEKLGKKVVILDADFGLANIEVMFGVIPKYNLSDLMFDRKEIREVISEGPRGVGFISGGSGIAKLVDLDKEQIKRLIGKLSELEEIADVVIVDTGAGISPSVMEFLVSSPEIILVSTPEPTSITDSYALLKALSMNEDFRAEETRIRMIANRAQDDREGRNLYDKLSAVVSKFLKVDLEFLGVIQQDQAITKAVMKQKPVSIMYPNAVSTKGFESIVEALEHNKTPLSTQRQGIRGYLKAVFSNKM